jgi:MFS-type transporter involved in bile tolerance (Atg22 family)
MLPAGAVDDAVGVDARGLLRRRLRESMAALWLLLAEPATRRLKVVIAIAAAGPVLAGTYLPLLLIGLVGDASRGAGYLAAATATGYVLAMLLSPVLGNWSDRRGNKPALLLVLLGTVAVALALSGVSGQPPVVAGVIIVVSIAGRWLNVLQRAI